MIEFINSYSPLIFLALEILAAIVGVFCFKKYKRTVAKYFIFFLVYTVIIVILGLYTFFVQDTLFLSFLKGTLLERNYWWYTIFWNIGAVLFFGWYYIKILNNDKTKNILRASLIIFMIVSLLSIIFTFPNLFKSQIPIISILGGLIILQCVFYYFLEIIQSDKILTFHKSLNFYISCAILILWLIQTPLDFFEPYYQLSDMDYINLRGHINLFVISFMYITYIIGLIVSKPEND